MRDLVRHGRPIQYAHIPKPLRLWDVWTKIAADPIAFEAPSAGFALDWRTLKGWRERGVGFATLSHAAGLSSTGDAALDRRLPFDEFYRISEACASAIEAAKSRSRRVIAIGTSVVRALESAASADGTVRIGEGRANGRIARGAPLRVVDAILTGVHQPGESHYELLGAFADDQVLDRVHAAAEERGYRTHEFGDSLLIERQGAEVEVPLVTSAVPACLNRAVRPRNRRERLAKGARGAVRCTRWQSADCRRLSREHLSGQHRGGGNCDPRRR